MAKKLMSLRAYAAHRGVTLRAVQKAIQAGRISTLKDGKIDAEIADATWEKTTDPSKQRGNVSASAASEAYALARANRETYNAKLAKLNYESRAGTLVDARTVQLQAFENARAVRDALLNMASRLAPQLASDTNPDSVHKLLAVELTRALHELVGLKNAKSETPVPAVKDLAPAVDQSLEGTQSV